MGIIVKKKPVPKLMAQTPSSPSQRSLTDSFFDNNTSRSPASSDDSLSYYGHHHQLDPSIPSPFGNTAAANTCFGGQSSRGGIQLPVTPPPTMKEVSGGGRGYFGAGAGGWSAGRDYGQVRLGSPGDASPDPYASGRQSASSSPSHSPYLTGHLPTVFPPYSSHNNSSELIPASSRSASRLTVDSNASSTSLSAKLRRRREKVWVSTALIPGEKIVKPWVNKKGTRPQNIWSYLLFLLGLVIGIAIAAYLVYSDYQGLEKGSFCLAMDDDFSGSSINSAYWTQDVSVGGHNVGDFAWYSGMEQNIRLDGDGHLVILPTLTSDYQSDTTQISIDSSTCTGSTDSECNVQSGSQQAINPVMSGRMNTKGKVELTYGRVEITAKMPTGNFIWPQISLMPVDSIYGPYPASGQIDIGESRGNLATKRAQQLNNELVGGLHWGPDKTTDRFSLTEGLYKVYRKFFNDEYYTFGVDWTPDSVFIWVNTRVRKTMNLSFKKQTFWQRGGFPATYANGSLISNPWANASSPFVAPFDQSFYLSVGVNVGGTNGYWGDVADKPWEDTNTLGGAMYSFLSKQSTWYPTWPSGSSLMERALLVERVKIWKYGANACS